MAASSLPTHLGRILPPVQVEKRHGINERVSEYIKYVTDNPGIKHFPMNFHMLAEDYDIFKKRFEKISERVTVFHPSESANYAIIMIVIAGITYIVIEMYRTKSAKL